MFILLVCCWKVFGKCKIYGCVIICNILFFRDFCRYEVGRGKGRSMYSNKNI